MTYYILSRQTSNGFKNFPVKKRSKKNDVMNSSSSILFHIVNPFDHTHTRTKPRKLWREAALLAPNAVSFDAVNFFMTDLGQPFCSSICGRTKISCLFYDMLDLHAGIGAFCWLFTLWWDFSPLCWKCMHFCNLVVLIDHMDKVRCLTNGQKPQQPKGNFVWTYAMLFITLWPGF